MLGWSDWLLIPHHLLLLPLRRRLRRGHHPVLRPLILRLLELVLSLVVRVFLGVQITLRCPLQAGQRNSNQFKLVRSKRGKP